MKFLHRLSYATLCKKALLALVLAVFVSAGMLIPKLASASTEFYFGAASKLYYSYSNGTPWDGFSGSFALNTPTNPSSGEFHYTTPDFPGLTLDVYNWGSTVSLSYAPSNESWSGGSKMFFGQLSNQKKPPYWGPVPIDRGFGAFAVKNASVNLGGNVSYVFTTCSTIQNYKVSCSYTGGIFGGANPTSPDYFRMRAPFFWEGGYIIFESIWGGAQTKMAFGSTYSLWWLGNPQEYWDGSPWNAGIGDPPSWPMQYGNNNLNYYTLNSSHSWTYQGKVSYSAVNVNQAP